MNDKALSTVVLALVFLAAVLPPRSIGRGDEPKLTIGLYESVLAGVSSKTAFSITDPLVQLLSRQLDGYPMQLEVVPGKSGQDLMGFGEKLDAGTWHVGIIWGLEYGWLRPQHNRLKPLVVVTPGQNLTYACQIMVCQESSVQGIDDLKDARLAVCRQVPLIERVYLQELLKREKRQTVEGYFEKILPFDTVSDAVWAVNDGEADCIVVNSATYARHIENQPGLKLRPLLVSEPLPEVVVVGRPDRVNELQSGLWDKLRQQLRGIDQRPEGRQCVDFWRVSQFNPDIVPKFETLVNQRIKTYPVKVLDGLWEPPRSVRRETDGRPPTTGATP